ncbi:MAG: hypothetical protein GWP50_02735 [Proteobacteria bacterium]|nr:hypothetical protein [Pseudomonadota bacterium]
MDSSQMELAQRHKQAHMALTVTDCYALVLAQTTENSILLTGDRILRQCSKSLCIQTHGVLWVFDQLVGQKHCSKADARDALTIWINDQAVFLPPNELQARIEHLSGRSEN